MDRRAARRAGPRRPARRADRVRAAAAGPARPGRCLRGGAARPRARRDPLVLPLHPMVLRSGDDRAARARAHGVALLGPVALLAASWAAMWKLDPFSDTRITDVFIYAHDAALLASGVMPYSAGFPFEYPPLPLLPMGGGRGLGGDYETTFGVLMALCALGTLIALYALAGMRAAWAFALTPLLAGAVLRTHFDLLAALVLAGTLLAFERRGPLLGFGLLGVGAMVKGFPAVIVPVPLAWYGGRGERRAAAAGGAVFAAVALAVSAPFLGSGYVDAYRFHVDRPVQIESTPAVVLYALGGTHVTGTATVADEFNSNGLRGGPADAVQAVFGVLALLSLALLAWLATRNAEPRQLTLC